MWKKRVVSTILILAIIFTMISLNKKTPEISEDDSGGINGCKIGVVCDN